MARTNLTEEEQHPHNWRARGMIVRTAQVKKLHGVDKSMMGSQPAFQETGREWFEYRSTSTVPNGPKYLGIPYLAPPSLDTEQIYMMLKAVYPSVKAEYHDEYTSDPAMRKRPQIIWDGYQFLTPRDADMIAQGFFTTLSFHNKMIELFRNPVTGKLSGDVHA